MKKYSVPAILLLVPLTFLAADDGSWSDSRGYTPSEGALYSEAGNPDIALEKEYLELGDYKSGATRAVFQFRNTSKKAVTVECAFPVRLEWQVSPLHRDQDGNLTDESTPGAELVWAWDWGDRYPAQAKGPYTATILDWLAAFDIRSWSMVPDESEGPEEGYKFITEEDYPTGRKEYAPDFTNFPVTISQDGKQVGISACVVDFGDKPGLITLHYRHRLSFAADKTSKVEVSYAFPGGNGAEGFPGLPGHYATYAWKYVLETGASWKGPIDSLVLALPPDFTGEPPAALKLIGAARGRLLYGAEAWEPGNKDNLDMIWNEHSFPEGTGRDIWFDQIRELDLANESTPVKGVTVLKASSTLPDNADIYTMRGVIPKAPFDAARLFDGINETPWVEGKTDDGIGEYVAFSLDSPMCLVAVQNGFLRSPIDLPDKALWSYFEKNNRVKSLEIQNDKGAKVAVLALADSRKLQYFAVDLPPGSYRAVIASVYRGSKWRDTCLGELRFYPSPASGETPTAALERLAADPFFGALVGAGEEVKGRPAGQRSGKSK